MNVVFHDSNEVLKIQCEMARKPQASQFVYGHMDGTAVKPDCVVIKYDRFEVRDLSPRELDIDESTDTKKRLAVLCVVTDVKDTREVAVKGEPTVLREIGVSVRASDGTAWRFPLTLWRQQAEVEIEEGSVILLGGATRKWDDFNRRGTFNLGEGAIVIPDFDTAQAREMKEWFVTSNELSDVELPDGAEWA